MIGLQFSFPNGKVEVSLYDVTYKEGKYSMTLVASYKDSFRVCYCIRLLLGWVFFVFERSLLCLQKLS